MSPAPPIIRFLQLCFLTYIVISVLYTTHYLFFSRLSELLVPSLRLIPGSTWTSHISPDTSTQYKETELATASLPVDLSDALWPADLSTSDSPLYFSSSALAQELGMDNAPRTPIREATFLSKAFAGAMHPTRIIPFYYRASGTVDERDVTITTLVTANRFKVFRQLVERYQGPISVTIHIPFPSQASLSSLPPTHPSVVALQRLHTLYTSSSLFSTYVDVHLALSPFAASARPGSSRTGEQNSDDSGARDEGEGEGGRQFNVWRNVARLFARTEFVMVLDVDFAVCTDWRGALREAFRRAESAPVSIIPEQEGQENGNPKVDLGNSELVKRLREGSAALVVPAFEYVNLQDGADQMNFPNDKETLLRLAQTSPPVITSFHASWAAGHNSTDYPRYFSIPPGSGEVYRVTQYQSAYEPYVIVSKRVTWCDERFTGYGANKAACLFEMYLSGVSFYVLADHFLIHQSHTYEEEARREERKYNRKLYADFKEEACLRYLDRYAREGTLHTPRGFNVQEECKKIKSIARIVPQLIEV